MACRGLLGRIVLSSIIAVCPHSVIAQVQAMLPSTIEGSTLSPMSAPVAQPHNLVGVHPGGVYAAPGAFYEDSGYWTWTVLPGGLMYRSYLAAPREPRFAGQWVHQDRHGWIWDVTLGGRLGLIRYGTLDDAWPEGWQIDIEGAAFPRLDLENEHDVVSTDFRAGIPLTFRRGPWEAKLGYYHLSSHLGDEYMVRFPSATRLNYVRDAMVAGLALRPVPAVRLYSEAGWAFNTDGGARPWEFQFGAEFSPVIPTGVWAVPFLAVAAHLRQENDFGGNVTLQTGVQWRGATGQLLRFGLHYFNGKSAHAQFFDEHEEQIGMGLWYDY